MQLIQNCEPRNVMLVHGEAEKMEFLKSKIKEEFKINCYMPANGETCVISTPVKIPVDVSLSLLKAESKMYNAQPPDPKRRRLIHGVLVVKDNKIILMELKDVFMEYGINKHIMRYTSKVKIDDPGPKLRVAEKLFNILQEKLSEWVVKFQENGKIVVESVEISIEDLPSISAVASTSDTDSTQSQSQKNICVTWNNQDEDLGSYILNLLHNIS